jgi:hypothetical protein
LSKDSLEQLNIEPKQGWFDCALSLDRIEGIKEHSLDEEDELYGCTVVYMMSGDTYIIDSKFEQVLSLWNQHQEKNK